MLRIWGEYETTKELIPTGSVSRLRPSQRKNAPLNYIKVNYLPKVT